MTIDFFVLGLCFILMHEMDAIRCHEWRILPITSFMKDKTGMVVFMLLHILFFYYVLMATTLEDQSFRFGFSIFSHRPPRTSPDVSCSQEKRVQRLALLVIDFRGGCLRSFVLGKTRIEATFITSVSVRQNSLLVGSTEVYQLAIPAGPNWVAVVTSHYLSAKGIALKSALHA